METSIYLASMAEVNYEEPEYRKKEETKKQLLEYNLKFCSFLQSHVT